MNESEGGVFEVVIDGALGPVLRWTLRPNAVDAARRVTTLRVVTDDPDIAGLVERIHTRGLRIESVWRLPDVS